MAVPVIGIPGYPLAAAVIFELFAVPLLAALQGRPAADRSWRRAQLACDWASSPDVEDWVPVSLAPAPGQQAGCPARGHAGQARRRVGQPADARPRLVADSRSGKGKFARGEHIDVRPIPGVPQ